SLSQSTRLPTSAAIESNPRLIGPRGFRERATMPSDVLTLPRESWQSELDRFSRQHERWFVSLTTRTPDGGTATEARDLPLEGVSIGSHTSDDVAVSLGTPRNHLTHDIRGVIAVRVELTDDRAERALVLESK